MFTTRIVSTLAPGVSELLGNLDAAAWANARWISSERNAGRDPPCCPKCGEVSYLADVPSSSRATFYTGAALLERRQASCGEIAAYVLGKLRADAGMTGRDPYAVGSIKLLEQEREGGTMLHAVVLLADGTELDETKEMIPNG